MAKRRRPLTVLEKVLLVNGGIGHQQLRKTGKVTKPFKRRSRDD